MKVRSEIIWGSTLLVYGGLVLATLALGYGTSGAILFLLTATSGLLLLFLGFLALARRGPSRFNAGKGFIVFLIPLGFLILSAAAPPPGTPTASEVPSLPMDDYSARMLTGDGPLVFTENNYFHLHDVLSTHPEAATGREVRIDGFLTRDSEGEPMVGRYLLWCCGSDAVYLGIALEGELQELPEGAWLEVSGTLGEALYSEGGRLVPRPVISVGDYRLVQEPEFVYVLPF